jgi:deazaflavin-dependent oxidoreductase (nitroreductase family)
MSSGVRDRAAEEAPKHTRAMRSARDGRLLSALMLPFFQLRPPRGYGVITTIGRKTGKTRRKCVRVITQGNSAYLVQLRLPTVAVKHPDSAAAWLWNIRTNPNVQLRIRGGNFAGVARELTDVDELAVARRAICDTVTLFDYGECDLHVRGLPTRTKIIELHRYWFDTGIPLVVELEGA